MIQEHLHDIKFVRSEAKQRLAKYSPGQTVNLGNLLDSYFWDTLSEEARRHKDSVLHKLVEEKQLSLLYLGSDSAGFRLYMVV